MTLFPPFPDIEEAMMAFLDELTVTAGPLAGQSYTQWPDLEGADYPLVRVERIGGRTNRLKDYPWVDVEVLAAGIDGKLVLQEIETALFSYPGAVPVGSTVVKFEDVSVRASLRRLPWSDDRVRRYAATYQITVSRS